MVGSPCFVQDLSVAKGDADRTCITISGLDTTSLTRSEINPTQCSLFSQGKEKDALQKPAWVLKLSNTVWRYRILLLTTEADWTALPLNLDGSVKSQSCTLKGGIWVIPCKRAFGWSWDPQTVPQHWFSSS